VVLPPRLYLSQPITQHQFTAPKLQVIDPLSGPNGNALSQWLEQLSHVNLSSLLSPRQALAAQVLSDDDQ
jgi:hypothetical protein